ncbi:hypothetical protein HOY80DRAFT_457293 [Tuber brumale]|nr:hypothetical protein HOY80DRAFT_457293 [Tuber brumale]
MNKEVGESVKSHSLHQLFDIILVEKHQDSSSSSEIIIRGEKAKKRVNKIYLLRPFSPPSSHSFPRHSIVTVLEYSYGKLLHRGESFAWQKASAVLSECRYGTVIPYRCCMYPLLSSIPAGSLRFPIVEYSYSGDAGRYFLIPFFVRYLFGNPHLCLLFMHNCTGSHNIRTILTRKNSPDLPAWRTSGRGEKTFGGGWQVVQFVEGRSSCISLANCGFGIRRATFWSGVAGSYLTELQLWSGEVF